MKRIPITAAKEVAKKYGYDQIVIIGRKVGEDGGEHVTTYGVNKEHCASAALQGKALKRFMGWPEEQPAPCKHENATRVANANTGNYDPSADCYWWEYTCPDCKAQWSEDQ